MGAVGPGAVVIGVEGYCGGFVSFCRLILEGGCGTLGTYAVAGRCAAGDLVAGWGGHGGKVV